MEHAVFQDPALTIALAAAAGMLAQTIARHARIPGIVLLLGTGAWLASRGIVAAAVSSLFAQTLEEAGIAGGEELRAMVFLVIAATVVLQGLTGGIVASWLGLRRPSNFGYVILGANGLARAVGEGEEAT